MRLFKIPDIRVFWSDDPGITKQFEVDSIDDPVVFKVSADFARELCDELFD